MAKIANTELSDTFDSWRNATNTIGSRLNQFAINESELYANTITANVELKTSVLHAYNGSNTINVSANLVTFTGKLTTYGANVNITGINTAIYLHGRTFTRQIKPFSDITYQIGNTSYRYLDVHTKNIHAEHGAFYGNSVNFDVNQITSTSNKIFGGSNTVISSTALNVTSVSRYLDDVTIVDDKHLYFRDGLTSYVRWNGGSLNVHDETAVKLKANTISMESSDGSDTYFTAAADGAVSLYYDNALKLNTVATGVHVTGNALFDDGGKATFGTTPGLEIYHSGSNSFIDETSGVGALYIRGSDLYLTDADGTNMLRAADNAGVTLYHNGATKFATTSAGASVTGNQTISGTLSYASANGAVHTNTSVSGTVTPDFQSYTHFVWNLTGNIVLANPTTEKVGQTGCFIFTHLGGARTVSLGSDYDAPSGTLSLSAVTGYVDVVPYIVTAPNRILLGTSTKNLS